MNVRIYKGKICWVKVTQEEAILLIRSLANQIVANSSNVGRLESYCDNDSDVQEISISVDFST